jgi:oligosaccharide translocation protein RFT1
MSKRSGGGATIVRYTDGQVDADSLAAVHLCVSAISDLLRRSIGSIDSIALFPNATFAVHPRLQSQLILTSIHFVDPTTSTSSGLSILRSTMTDADDTASVESTAPPARRYESGSSLRSMVYLVAHQLATRLGTFILNIMVARHIGPVAYGISAVHLYLLNTMILFITREAIRRSACAWHPKESAHMLHQPCALPSVPLTMLTCASLVRSTLRYSAPASLSPLQGAIYERIVLINLSWLSLLASIPLCFIFRALFIYSAPVFDARDPATSAALSAEFAHCITLYTLASFIELLSEPLYILLQKQQRVRARVMIDAAAVMVRCGVTFGCMKYGTATAGGLLAFAYGQLSFASVIVLGYYAYCCYEMWRNGSSKKSDAASTDLVVFTHPRDLLPQRLPKVADSSASSSSAYTDPGLLRLTTQLTFQSLEKFALTEGEKLVLVSLNSNLDAQGIYGLIQNLGSLVARMIFQPLEESAFMEFSLLFASVTSEREKRDLAQATTNAKQNGDGAAALVSDPSASSDATSSSSSAVAAAASYASAVRMLGVLLHFVLLLGLVLLCFGPAYSYVFLDLLYGSKWSSTAAPTILSYYCVYILFMALNGVTEAFVSAVISTRQLRTYNLCLIAFSVIYLAACALLLPYGSSGLIAANCINMSLRIAYSTWFIIRFFTQATGTVAAATSDDADDKQPESSLVRQLWSRVLPDLVTLQAFLTALIVTNGSFIFCNIEGSHSLSSFAMHIGVGAMCLAAVAVTIWRRERLFISELKGLAGRKKKAA